MKYYLLILVSIFSLACYANPNYQKGYIISLRGDTVSGFLLIQNSLNASKTCVFKKQAEDSPLTFNPGDINGYRYLNSKFYVSKEFIRDSTEKRMVFMEYIINGISSIYYFRDSHGDHYLIEKENIGLIELTNSELNTTKPKIFESIYRGKLNIIMSDCNEIKPLINKTRLNHKSLINVSVAYHEKVCTTRDCIIYERENLSAVYKFNLILGLSLNQYNFGNRLKSNYAPSYQFGAGLKMYNVIFSNEKTCFDIKFLMEKDSRYIMSASEENTYNYKVTYNGVDYNINPDNAFNSVPDLPVNLNVLNFKIPCVVNFEYPFPKAILYWGFGLSDKIIISYNTRYIDRSFEDQYGKTFNTLLIGGIANLGIDKILKNGNAFGVNLNLEYLVVPRALNSFLRLRENQVSLQFLYSFAK